MHIDQNKWEIDIFAMNKLMDRILNKHNIRTVFKSPKKIGQILRNLKDQRPPLNFAGIYKIPCFCGQVYSIEKPGEWSTYG